MSDRIRHLTLSHVVLPLENPVSDAKVLTGRQKPLTETVLLFVEVVTEQGPRGHGLLLLQARGRPGPVRPPGGGRRRRASVRTPRTSTGSTSRCCGRAHRSAASGVATQAIAALDVALWDLKARRAGLPLAKLIGAHRDSCPRATTRRVDSCRPRSRRSRRRPPHRWRPASAASKSRWGQPDWKTDLNRVAALQGTPRRHPVHGGRQPAVGPRPGPPDVPRARGVRPGVDRGALDAWDAVGHADLSRTFDTPIATGEMLTSVS